MEQKWPSLLWVVRHGQSSGNVARDAAEAARLPVIDIVDRDIDVPLSALGEQQARALGRWFGRLPEAERPEIVLCSPYVRAVQTAKLVVQEAGLTESLALRCDERLREKEFGILDRLTKFGIAARHAELNEQRLHVGKFYFRPPGGESWCDVILRLRSLTEMVAREYAEKRVLVVAHQVIVNCMRYLLEELNEKEILAIDREADVPNCGVTSYQYDPQRKPVPAMALKLVNFVAPLEEAGAPVTAEPDAQAAPKP